MNHITDPQCLAFEGRPYDQHQVDVMEWLAHPDGGALRTDQACHVAREIAMGRVPHVGMMHVPEEPFEPLRADLLAPCGTEVSIEASHFDMSHVTTALARKARWIVKLLRKVE